MRLLLEPAAPAPTMRLPSRAQLRLFRAAWRPGDAPALTVRGPFHGSSGHDHHVRQFIRHLHQEGVRLRLADLRRWGSAELPASRTDTWYDSLNTNCRTSSVLHFCMPHQVRRRAGLLNVNYTMFESNRICGDWVRHNLRHDLVIVPTESSREAWLNAGFPSERIETCPLGVDASQFHPDAEPLALTDDSGRPVSSYHTRFLNVSEVIPRKNLAGLIRVWIRATSREDDAILILKLSSDSSGWLAFKKSLVEVEREIGKSLSEAAPTLFIGSILAEKDMPRLFATATHYWSMSCGEGWDLPMTEAAATRLRLIAPNHSGYKTYLDSSIARMIPATAVPAQCPPDLEIAQLFTGSEWWQPDENAAVDHVSTVIRTGGEGDPTARDRVAIDFTWTAAAQRLKSLLQKLHDDHDVAF